MIQLPPVGMATHNTKAMFTYYIYYIYQPAVDGVSRNRLKVITAINQPMTSSISS